MELTSMDEVLRFYQGKRVFVTGHTGFKGAWLSKLLLDAGAQVTGYALEPPTDPSLFAILGLNDRMNSTIGDIRDFDKLRRTFEAANPQVVLHLAAQPLVRASYKFPRYTYETNVMGTVNILECVRLGSGVESFLNVTTDKVYRNYEWDRGYEENDRLDGFDPYSNSKSCSELVTNSYRRSFFADLRVPISTARAGNVIGGGDFACDRIIPDCVRAILAGESIKIRNPHSIRPYEHVLEPLFAYLMIAARQVDNAMLASCYNVGPDDCDCVTTGELAEGMCQAWNKMVDCKINHSLGRLSWVNESDGGPHEASFLKLDCTLLKDTFGWTPRWRIEQTLSLTAEWTHTWLSGGDVDACMTRQIKEYLSR